MDFGRKSTQGVFSVKVEQCVSYSRISKYAGESLAVAGIGFVAADNVSAASGDWILNPSSAISHCTSSGWLCIEIHR